MSSRKYTPGPWKQYDGHGADRRRPVIVDSIPDRDGRCVANCICFVASTNADVEANAQVLAATPELLEALCSIYQECDSELWDEIDSMDDGQRVSVSLCAMDLKRMRNAINKALGS